MKIHTITCHNVYNTGASLQSYALATYLKELGHKVEIVDYVPNYLRHYKLWGDVGNPRFDKPVLRQMYSLAKFPGRLKLRLGARKRKFDRFTKAYLPLTRKHYSTFAELTQDPPRSELYLAGSDQIWNTFFPIGRDPAYYLQFAPEGSIRASYAASFAVHRIEPKYQAQSAARIGALDHIAVRETSGLEILRELGIDGGIQVVDPVFLLDTAHWDRLCPATASGEPYILVYDFDNNPVLRREALELAAKHGLKLYTLQDLGYGDRSFPKAGPIEFVQLIRGAEYVLSNSFHATAFSLIYRRPYLTVDRGEGINARMQDLNRLVGLENRAHADDPIDWADVQSRLDARIAVSKHYLQQITTPTGGPAHD